MASSYAQRWSDPPPGQSRRRGGAMLLAVLAHLLVILLLLRLAPLPVDLERKGDGLKTFQVAPGRKDAAKHAQTKPKQLAHTAKSARPPTRPSPRAAAVPGVDASAIWALGRGLYKGSDIAAITSANQGETASADTGGDAGDSQPVGAGPGGRSMYAAQWYVEPSDAEMRTYLPASITPSSWAIVACQTAPRYHVENCRELEESPPGAGLTRALRQAAWQFRVTPPRVDGKPLIGAWVRIRFDFTERGGIRVRR